MSLLPQIITYFSLYRGFNDLNLIITIIPIIIFGSNNVIIRINRKFENHLKAENSIYMNTKIFIEEHNKYCQLLESYNKFWSKIYLILILNVIPMNLLLIHKFLFENLLPQTLHILWISYFNFNDIYIYYSEFRRSIIKE